MRLGASFGCCRSKWPKVLTRETPPTDGERQRKAVSAMKLAALLGGLKAFLSSEFENGLRRRVEKRIFGILSR